MPYAEVLECHTRSAIRGCHTWSWFLLGVTIRGTTIREDHTQDQKIFLDKLPYAGHTDIHTQKSYVELVFIGGCHTQDNHTRRPYGKFFLDKIFFYKLLYFEPNILKTISIRTVSIPTHRYYDITIMVLLIFMMIAIVIIMIR